MYSYKRLVNFEAFTELLPDDFEIAESSLEDHLLISFDPKKERFPTEILLLKAESIYNFALYGKLNLNIKSNREGRRPYFVYYYKKNLPSDLT